MNPRTFNLDVWQSRVMEVRAVFRAFEAFLANEEAVGQHLDAQQLGIPTTDPRLIELSKIVAAHHLTGAADLYRRQVIVVAGTLLEAMMRDFFTALFVRHPMRMSAYVENRGKGEGRHRVLLKDVVEAESRDRLIEDLARRSAAKIPVEKFVDQLERPAKMEPKPDLAADLKDIVEQRNRIVHEDSREPISVSHVSYVIQWLLDLGDQLADVATANGVPVARYENLLEKLRLQIGGTS
jgi:hypothetical protein